jgi:hypothetical protein
LDTYFEPREETGYVVEMDLTDVAQNVLQNVLQNVAQSAMWEKFPNAPQLRGNILWRVFPPWEIGQDEDMQVVQLKDGVYVHSLYDCNKQYTMTKMTGRPKRDPWKWSGLF